MRAGGVDPVGHRGQRAFAVVGRLVAFDLRQRQRQLGLVQRHPAAFLAPHQRNRLAPVALPREHPVAQLVVDLLPADAALLQKRDHLLLRLRDGQPVQEPAVDQRARLGIGERRLHNVAAGDDLDDGQAEHFGKIIVALVVRGYGHNRARAVGDQHIVGDEDRNLLPRHGVDRRHAVQPHAGLVLGHLGALEVALARRLLAVGGDLVVVGQPAAPLLHQRMLGRDDHIGRAEDGVRAGGEHAQRVARGGGEIDLRAVGAADPVALGRLDALDVIDRVQIVHQTVGVGGDLQHPLAFGAVHDLAAAALADAADDLLVGKDDLAGGTPVDVHFLFIRQPRLEQTQENPLRPAVIRRVGGVDLTLPVEGQPQRLELLAEAAHVVLGHDGRMDLVGDGIVLGRQAERVPAHREQNVVALHPPLARDDVQRRIGPRMPAVQPRARGVRELDERIILLFRKILRRAEGARRLPALLPLLLRGRKIVLHRKHPVLPGALLRADVSLSACVFRKRQSIRPPTARPARPPRAFRACRTRARSA